MPRYRPKAPPTGPTFDLARSMRDYSCRGPLILSSSLALGRSAGARRSRAIPFARPETRRARRAGNATMKFAGDIYLKAPRAAVFAKLRDARFFASCVEGVRDLNEIDPDHYTAVRSEERRVGKEGGW